MIIVYDVSHIQRQRGGIGRYSLSLLQQNVRTDTENRYILHGWSFSIDRPALQGIVSPRCTLSTKKIPGAIKRAYWERARVLPLIYFTGPFDIFHSADPFFPPVGRRKVVVTVYDLLSKTHPQYFERSMVRRDSRLERWVGRADAVVVPSRFTRKQLIRSGIVPAHRIHVVPPPVSSLFSSGHSPLDEATVSRHGLRRPYMLFVGTIEPRKNLPGLVGAFEVMCGKGITGIDLVIAGKMGWMSGDLQRRIAGSPYCDRIRWLRYVPESDIGALYRGALCLVYPSFVEGYGLPVAEAMACGVPVVTSDSSGMKEVAGGAAMLVDPLSIADISRAMTTLAGDSGARGRLGAAGLLRAEALRVAADPRTVIQVYESLVRQ